MVEYSGSFGFKFGILSKVTHVSPSPGTSTPSKHHLDPKITHFLFKSFKSLIYFLFIYISIFSL